MRLFRRVTLRHALARPAPVLLSLLGVALGVGVIGAIRLANVSAFEAFRASIDLVSGTTNLQVVAESGSGMPASVFPRVRSLRMAEAATPVIEQVSVIVGARGRRLEAGIPVLLLGVEPFSDAAFGRFRPPGDSSGRVDFARFLTAGDALFLTRGAAERAGLRRGDTAEMVIGGAYRRMEVLDVVEPTSGAARTGLGAAIVDIAVAQRLLEREGRIDRIDLRVPRDRIGEARAYLQSTLPAGLVARTPEARSAQVETMIEAYGLNLTALSFIALLVAMFVIYNTVLMSALRRRRELGILRVVGATPGQVFRLFLGEALAIGLVGSLLGAGVALLLAENAVAQVARTISNLYVAVVVEGVEIDPWVLVQGLVIGVVSSILAAIPAALEASRVHPRETFTVEALETRARAGAWRVIVAGVSLLAAAALASMQGSVGGVPVFGFLAAGLAVLGAALAMPGVLRATHRALRPLARRMGIEVVLGTDYLVLALARTSTAVAALMVAIAMVVGLLTMIASFRSTVLEWIGQTIRADVYVAPASNRISARTASPMPRALVDSIRALPFVAASDAYVARRLTYQGRTVILGAGDILVRGKERWSGIMAEGSFAEAEPLLRDGDAALVSEAFALRFGTRVGDTLRLPGPNGAIPVLVAGVVLDYASDAGLIYMNRSLYERRWGDSAVVQISLHLREGVEPDAARAEIERRFSARYALLALSNRGLRGEVVKTFDETFAITWALQGIAVLVALIGIVNALAALVLERARELAVLRAVGTTPRQMLAVILANALGMATVALASGVVVGLALSAILIYVINRQSFGWTIQPRVPWGGIALFTVAVIGAVLVAGLIAGTGAARRGLREALANE